MTLLEIARMTEDEARSYLEGLRWPNGPVCPHCGSEDVTQLNGEAHLARLHSMQQWRVPSAVHGHVKSVMERSKVSLVKWCLAFHLICSSKKGFSALQLQRKLGLGSYRTAWFMMHRIRHAMAEGELTAPTMSGTVEADESLLWRQAETREQESPAEACQAWTRHEQAAGRRAGRTRWACPIQAGRSC